MTREQLKTVLDNLDDGQEDGEPIARPIPGLTAGDVRYLLLLIEADQKLNLT